MFRILSTPVSLVSLLVLLSPLGLLRAQEIPDELLEDEHFREEMGVNMFTTPSIRKIFEDLHKLRPLPYEELKRPVPERPPKSRTKLALVVGVLLADGFLAVEAEQFLELEPVGRSLLAHAKGLGSGKRISSHMKSMLEKGALSDWDDLKEELARTQADVEKEMVLLRDVDTANLISLAGWLRAVEIASASALNPYDPEKASVLSRPEIVSYFLGELETMSPSVTEDKTVATIKERLGSVQELVNIPEQEIMSEEEVQELRTTVEKLIDRIVGSERLILTSAIPAGESEGEKPNMKKPDATGGVISGEVPE